jgi:hypothetical protein
MWYGEETLRDVVILNPVDYFVKPVSRLICDPVLHNIDAHEYSSRHHPVDYPSMRRQGVVSEPLLRELLRFESPGTNCEALTALMLMYGLLVEWKLRDTLTIQYWVPALLPSNRLVAQGLQLNASCPEIWMCERPVTGVFIVFSLHKSLLNSTLHVERFAEKCFLPCGLFERLACALLRWSLLNTDIDPENFQLWKNVLVMQMANVKFRLVLRLNSNCIEVCTAVRTPITLIRRLEMILNRLIKESVQSLYLQPVIHSENYLLPLKPCMTPAATYIFRAFDDGSVVVFDGAAVRQAHPWLQGTRSRIVYDVFLSHRWGAPDDALVASVFDQLSDYVVDDLPISIFYDDRHMKHGHRMDQEFFSALLRSSVMVPLVSMNALQRMMNIKPANIDDVLVEWLTAVVFNRFPLHFQRLVSLRKILPVVSKELDGTDYFSVINANMLSESVPTGSCKAVLVLFEQANISLPTEVKQFISTVTVKDIVYGIMRWKCVEVDKDKDSIQDIASECVTSIVKVVLKSCVDAHTSSQAV